MRKIDKFKTKAINSKLKGSIVLTNTLIKDFTWDKSKKECILQIDCKKERIYTYLRYEEKQGINIEKAIELIEYEIDYYEELSKKEYKTAHYNFITQAIEFNLRLAQPRILTKYRDLIVEKFKQEYESKSKEEKYKNDYKALYNYYLNDYLNEQVNNISKK